MKTQNLLKSIFGVALIAALLLVASCDSANNPSALAGHWLYESGGPYKTDDMELFKDGTGVCGGVGISWKVENKRFIIQSSSFGMASDYEVSGYRLTLTDNPGKVTYLNINSKSYQKSLQKGSFTDSRDGKKYGTVKIGTQTWMAENLNYNANGSKCYDGSESNCQKYGRLYNWNAALTACPQGWHLPSDAEWQALVDFAGGEIAGKTLKARSGWANSGNGTDAFGFSALPGGIGYSDGYFPSVGIFGRWWSRTEIHASNARYRGMDYYNARVSSSRSDKSGLYSVRCVQD